MSSSNTNAPGQPGYPLPWATSRKSGVGVAPDIARRVWFTVANGIVTEVFYPRLDLASIRDFQFLVADGKYFFSEERRDTESSVRCLSHGVPGYHIENTCSYGKYTLIKEVIANSDYDALLVNCRFEPNDTFERTPHLYATLAPRHTCPKTGCSAHVCSYRGDTMLVSERETVGIAMACSLPFLQCSVGYVGISDGWTDIANNKKLTARYERAERGHVGLVGEVDWTRARKGFCIAIGFGRNGTEAAHRARGSLLQGFPRAKRRYIAGWREWQDELEPLVTPDSPHHNCFRVSAGVLATHTSRDFHGGAIASLSCPWGNLHTDDDLGGYHLIWPRDLYHATVGFAAIGANEEALAALSFFQTTQEKDGHWPQNMWLDGDPYGDAKQLDEVAAPILAASLACSKGLMGKDGPAFYWAMVEKAADYICREGPATNQDRWEELGGISLHSLSVAIAALLSAAEIADQAGKPGAAARWRGYADEWNESIEDWCYVEGSELARKFDVSGHYIRMRPVNESEGDSLLPMSSKLFIANRPDGDNLFRADEIVSPDALALVRYGLRRPEDPKILNTIKVIDSLLKVDTPHGPLWKRYNHDGYGEKENGDPFDGCGVGRPWPLLTGERAHYELAAGKPHEARRLLATMEKVAGASGLLPEQIWDERDIPGRKLRFGRATGSARPLVWAHAEYLALLRSLRDGGVFDLPMAAAERYHGVAV